MNVTWKVSGVRGVVRNLDKFEKSVHDRLKAAVYRAADRVKTLAMARVPVSNVSKAGHVHLIQTITRRPYSRGGIISARVGSPAKYARYVEFLKKGKRRPKPYLYPALYEAAPQFRAEVERILRQEARRHSG